MITNTTKQTISIFTFKNNEDTTSANSFTAKSQGQLF